MMTKDRLLVLRLLSNRPQTVIDLVSEKNINTVLGLVKLGFARDFSDHKGHRVPVRLRIWGITEAGRAVLEQETIGGMMTRKIGQFSLLPPLPVRVTEQILKPQPPNEGE